MLTYRDSGVDIDEGNRAVNLIKNKIKGNPWWLSPTINHKGRCQIPQIDPTIKLDCQYVYFLSSNGCNIPLHPNSSCPPPKKN